MKLADDALKGALRDMKRTDEAPPPGFADRVMARVRRERRRRFWTLAVAASALIAGAFAARSAVVPEPALVAADPDLRELEALREDYRLLLEELDRARRLSAEPVVPFGAHDDLDLFLDVRSLWERPPERVVPVSQRRR